MSYANYTELLSREEALQRPIRQLLEVIVVEDNGQCYQLALASELTFRTTKVRHPRHWPLDTLAVGVDVSFTRPELRGGDIAGLGAGIRPVAVVGEVLRLLPDHLCTAVLKRRPVESLAALAAFQVTPDLNMDPDGVELLPDKRGLYRIELTTAERRVRQVEVVALDPPAFTLAALGHRLATAPAPELAIARGVFSHITCTSDRIVRALERELPQPKQRDGRAVWSPACVGLTGTLHGGSHIDFRAFGGR